MRSIGKVKIKKLKVIVAEEMSKIGKWDHGYSAYSKAREVIKSRIPEEWYDTWECAWSEIERLVDDFVNDYQFKGGLR